MVAHGLPPNTQGLTALQILGVLEGFDVSSWGDGTTDYYHHMTEATKLAFADRDAWITDPEMTEIPGDDLVAPDYLRERRQLIEADEVLPIDCAPGSEPAAHEWTAREPGGDTCYFGVVDFGYDVQQAIDAPRWLFGRTWGAASRSLSLEKRAVDEVITDLTDLGHAVSLCRAYDETMGHAQAIRIHDNGMLSGGADPRGDGAALGY